MYYSLVAAEEEKAQRAGFRERERDIYSNSFGISQLGREGREDYPIRQYRVSMYVCVRVCVRTCMCTCVRMTLFGVTVDYYCCEMTVMPCRRHGNDSLIKKPPPPPLPSDT